MIGVLFSALVSTWILLAGFANFASSSFAMFRKDFTRQARANMTSACLSYGDLLARTGAPGSPFPAECLTRESGACVEPITCTITITGGIIYVKFP